MSLEIHQLQKLAQQLVMTPQLQQAIKLLQLSRVELQEMISKELQDNPALEEGTAEETENGDQPKSELPPESAEPLSEKLLTRLVPTSEKLLTRFIDDKLSTYVEPSKKGTPKGERVGFSRTKYRATLYALRGRVLDTTEDLIAQAKELKVSYGLLRKWRSEQDFKNLVSQHEKEFTGYLLQILRRSDDRMRIQNAKRKVGELLDQSLKELQSINTAARDSKQKELVRKLMILIQGNIQNELTKSDVKPQDLQKYQQLALDQAIELLQDRRAATKHRRDIIKLLSGIRESMK